MKQTRGSGGPPPEPNFLIVGRVLRAWGIRGDLKIQPMTDRPADFARLTQVYVGAPPRRYEVQSFRPYQGNWLLHLVEVSTRTQAEALHDQPILIERVQRQLEADEYLADHAEESRWIANSVSGRERRGAKPSRRTPGRCRVEGEWLLNFHAGCC